MKSTEDGICVHSPEPRKVVCSVGHRSEFAYHRVFGTRMKRLPGEVASEISRLGVVVRDTSAGGHGGDAALFAATRWIGRIFHQCNRSILRG